MKTLTTIQKISKLGKTLSKIAFVFSVIGFVGCLAGLCGMGLGGGTLIKIGGVTLHGWILNDSGYSMGSIAAALAAWAIVCAGEAVLAKFSEKYFKNELKAGTPFTFAGAKEMLRLGILILAVPTGCAVAGSIVEGLVAGFMEVEKAAVMDMRFGNEMSITLGVMFILAALLCRYGAELRQSDC